MPYSEQRITEIRRWSHKTFSFHTTRPEGFAFDNGQFVTLGLRKKGKLIPRAYSIVSDPQQENLEFLSIHVPDGALTSHLSQARVGDSIWINSKITGSLTLNHVLPGRNIYLLATGTGIAPFISLLRGSAIYQSFEAIVLVHTVRTIAELSYREELEGISQAKFHYVPTVTREEFAIQERGSDLFCSGRLCQLLQLPSIDPDYDRVMLCGNPQMNRDMTFYLKEKGWAMTNYRGKGSFTVEQAFVATQEANEEHE